VGEDRKRDEDRAEIFMTKSTCGVTWWTVSFEGQAVLEFSVEPGHFYLVDLEVKIRGSIRIDINAQTGLFRFLSETKRVK